jgi:hypothetical protein
MLEAGITFLHTDDLEPEELREASVRSARAKNVALWVSPFETFLLLDADTVVWGDMRELADFRRYDFVIDSAGVEPLHAVMDVDQVVSSLPDLAARNHVGDYVNNGVYFGRRGVLDLERYLHALRIARERPGMLYGAQGSFNYMLFSAADEGSIRLGQRRLQVQTGRPDGTDVARHFTFDGSGPVVVGDPVALHWVASAKPRVREGPGDHFSPMTHFRLEFRRTALGAKRSLLPDPWHLRLEDTKCSDFRTNGIRGRIARSRRRSRSRYAELRVRLRRRTPDWVVEAMRGDR